MKKKNKEDLIADTLFWPVMPTAAVMEKLDEYDRPHIIQPYIVPFPQLHWRPPSVNHKKSKHSSHQTTHSPDYSEVANVTVGSYHDHALYSLWMHFVEYCQTLQLQSTINNTTSSTADISPVFDAVFPPQTSTMSPHVNNEVNFFEATEVDGMPESHTTKVAEDASLNIHTGAPRLPFFVKLSNTMNASGDECGDGYAGGLGTVYDDDRELVDYQYDTPSPSLSPPRLVSPVSVHQVPSSPSTRECTTKPPGLGQAPKRANASRHQHQSSSVSKASKAGAHYASQKSYYRQSSAFTAINASMSVEEEVQLCVQRLAQLEEMQRQSSTVGKHMSQGQASVGGNKRRTARSMSYALTGSTASQGYSCDLPAEHEASYHWPSSDKSMNTIHAPPYVYY